MIIKSCPSFVIPATYLENVEFIFNNLKEIKGIELLFFFMDSESKRLFNKESKRIFSNFNEFYYTLHLPDDLIEVDFKFLEKIDPFIQHYIIHPPIDDYSKKTEKNYLKNYFNVLEKLILRFGNKFLVENLIHRDIEEVINRFKKINIVIDIGHCIMKGENPVKKIEKYKYRVKEFHIHGVLNNKDHNSISIDRDDFSKDNQKSGFTKINFIYKTLEYLKNDTYFKKLFESKSKKIFINFEMFNHMDVTNSIKEFKKIININ